MYRKITKRVLGRILGVNRLSYVNTPRQPRIHQGIQLITFKVNYWQQSHPVIRALVKLIFSKKSQFWKDMKKSKQDLAPKVSKAKRHKNYHKQKMEVMKKIVIQRPDLLEEIPVSGYINCAN
ncbi:hypothetical protein QAD02_016274 [Eretmocerus hayati]|uniref:Uncharacterized protein n=1 Tax=Eretmocerus hayati TaxID=131215 RepID=A0ACC2PDG9_9HYME|nr:hypothetical protein QAD02_016274 [Eretmocerus hayati]